MTNLVNPYRFGGGVAFSPDDVSGLILWLDAADLSTLWQDSGKSTTVTSDTDPVGYWADKSSSGNDWTQPTAAKRPIYKENFNTSYAGLFFDVTGTLNLVGAMAEAANDWTMFYVCQTITTGYLGEWLTGRLILGHSAASTFGYYDGAWRSGSGTPSSPSVVTYQLNSSANGVVNINRSQIVSTSYSQKALGGTQRMGTEDTGTAFSINGHIASVLIYTGNLSSGDITSVEDYLADRYGITLP